MNSFLFNHLRFQIAAATILIVLETVYFFRPKIRLLSNRIFSVLMISAACYLVFDFATIFALVYYDSAPLWLVRLTHQGFIFFLDIALSCIYLYIDILNRNQKRYSRRKMTALGCLYFRALISIIFAPLDYYVEDDGIYSYGMMANVVYAVIIIYSAMTVFQSLRNLVKSKHKKQQIYVLLTMALWIGFGGIQIIMPKILISSVGVSAMILLMFLSLENPSEYIDSESRLFNYYALKSVLSEYMENSRKFMIVDVCIEEAALTGDNLGDDFIADVIVEIRSFIDKVIKADCYRLNRTSIVFVLNERQMGRAKTYLSILEGRFKDKWNFRGSMLYINAHADVMSCPEDFPFEGGVSELLDFLEDSESYSETPGFIRRTDEKSRARRIRRLSVIRLVSEAVKNDGIEMYYQPIYNLETGRFTNTEALVRLKDHDTLGFVSPEEFIPLAEKNGLIMELSDLILHKVFRFMSQEKLEGYGVRHVEVNLSGLQSVDSNLPMLMKNLLNEYHVAPESVNLEITESIAVNSGYMLKKNMDELRKFGCSFAMDDFGTGYSNLSRMTKGDFEMIKIDKSLLWPCFSSEAEDKESVKNAKILLENMISMLLKMGREIVVEGSETKEQFDYLAALGITYAQGYYFSRPMPESDYLQFLKDKED